MQRLRKYGVSLPARGIWCILTRFWKKLDRLARVRENQRKSRARKQEYVKELEQRLATFKEEAQQRDIENRIALQKVEAENRHLKNLLASLGFSAPSVNHYLLQLADQDTPADRKVAIPVMKRPEASSAPSCNTAYSTSSQVTSNTTCSSSSQVAWTTPSSTSPQMTSTPSEKEDSSEQPPVHDSVLPWTCTPPAQDPTDQQQKCPTPSLYESNTEQPEPESGSSDEQALNTTLCVVADMLIAQYNTRGVDMDELRRRICLGLKQVTDLDCCRVENNVLFQVLDDISNDI